MWINCSMPCLRTWSACCFVSDHDKGDPRERRPMATISLNCKYNKQTEWYNISYTSLNKSDDGQPLQYLNVKASLYISAEQWKEQTNEMLWTPMYLWMSNSCLFIFTNNLRTSRLAQIFTNHTKTKGWVLRKHCYAWDGIITRSLANDRIIQLDIMCMHQMQARKKYSMQKVDCIS